jgi:F0F1-type ATP synthase membrane subunit b/b'
METTMLIELIPTLGFPIVCVIGMGVFIYHIYKQSVKREAELMGEIKENRKINQKFSEIIAKYEITLEEIKTDVKDIKDKLQ